MKKKPGVFGRYIAASNSKEIGIIGFGCRMVMSLEQALDLQHELQRMIAELTAFDPEAAKIDPTRFLGDLKEPING